MGNMSTLNLLPADESSSVTANDDDLSPIGHRSRMRERLFKSQLGELSDQEILEHLLCIAQPRRDMKPLARRLLNQCSLANLLNTPVDDLIKIKGLGHTSAAVIRVVLEAATRLIKAEMTSAPILQSWHALVDYCRATMGHLTKENFRVIYLNRGNMVIADELQETGTVDETPIYPREIAKRALLHDAAAVVIAHNHPSGVVAPSTADIAATEKLVRSLAVLRIKLHDHIIVSYTGYFSFKDNGLL